MPCYRPLKGFRSADGAIVFHSKVPEGAAPITVACQQCRGCRRNRAMHWAVRCMHEAQLWPLNCFITLTYKDNAVRSLDYSHYQLFMRYLRRARPRTKVRFFMCGEYGEMLHRPHFHAILFNCDFGDREYFKTAGGHKLFISRELQRLWPRGHSLIGGVSFQSAAYIASYVLPKVTGDLAQAHYLDRETGEIRVPEFCHMSLKPGIGAQWLDRFGAEVYPEGTVLINGVLRNAPKYYDRRYRVAAPEDYESMLSRRRMQRFDQPFLEYSDPRLAVKAKVADAQEVFFRQRTL